MPPQKKPRISILERRLQNPFGEQSVEIVLKDKSLVCRWFNDNAHGAGGQIYRAKTSLGWFPVTPDMVEDLDSIGSHDINAANQIARGARGEEILMWQPKDQNKAIALAKARANLEKMRDYDRTKQDVVNAAAAELGDQAASMFNQFSRPVGGVRTSYERIETTPGSDE